MLFLIAPGPLLLAQEEEETKANSKPTVIHNTRGIQPEVDGGNRGFHLSPLDFNSFDPAGITAGVTESRFSHIYLSGKVVLEDAALIDSAGLRKLEALSDQVPNLLARNSLSIGDWKETVTEDKRAGRDLTRTRIEVLAFTETEITLRIASRKGRRRYDPDVRVQPRKPFFSREYLEWFDTYKSQWIQESRMKTRRILIRSAEFQGFDEIEVQGEKLDCGRIYLSYTRETEHSHPYAEVTRNLERITCWYHEKIPIDGIVKREADYSVSWVIGYGTGKDRNVP